MAPAAFTTAQHLGLAGLTFGTLALSGILVVVRGGNTMKEHGVRLESRMGQASWDFSGSFATNLAIIGSVLTIILTSGVFPSDTKILPSGAYGGLAIFFGVVVLVAPLLYNGTAIRVKVTDPQDFDTAAEYHGTVRGFLIASCVTAWALIGSVATAFLALVELERESSLTIEVVIALGLVLAAALGYFVRYLWVRIDGTIVNEVELAGRLDAAMNARREHEGMAGARGRDAAAGASTIRPASRWTLL